MALGLVARSVYALSAHLNSYYRVFKGTDPENVYLRLPTAGSFEVRHSATNAPVFRVTDAGMVGAIGGANIIDGSVGNAELASNAVDSSKIADGSIVNADVSPTAAIAYSKLNLAASITSNDITDGSIVNADVNASAAIAYSKLTLASSITSADIVDGTLVNGDVSPTAAIAYSKLNLANSITSADILDNAIQNADIFTAANIAVTKLAHVGTGNVLKSNGTTNVGAQIVNADIATGANIDGAKLADNSVPAIKISGGATIPANSIDSSHIINGSIATADLAAGAITRIALTYAVATDIHTATAVGTSYIDIIANQAFTVTDASSIIMLMVRGNGTFTCTSNGYCMVRPFIDNAGNGPPLSGNVVLSTSNQNPFAGGGTLLFTGLTVGSHNVKLCIVYSNTTGVLGLTAAAGFQHLSMSVVEVLR